MKLHLPFGDAHEVSTTELSSKSLLKKSFICGIKYKITPIWPFIVTLEKDARRL